MKLFFMPIFLIFSINIHAYPRCTPQHYSLYLCAQYNQQQKNIDQAQEYYAQLFKTEHLFLYFLMLTFYLIEGLFNHYPPVCTQN